MTCAKIDLIDPQMMGPYKWLMLDWSVGLGASFRRWAGGWSCCRTRRRRGPRKSQECSSYNISSCSINDETRQDFLSAKKLISTAIVRDANFLWKKNSRLIKFWIFFLWTNKPNFWTPSDLNQVKFWHKQGAQWYMFSSHNAKRL